jgi:hypothetical protein
MMAAVVMLVAALLCSAHNHESALGLHTATTTVAPAEADHHDHEARTGDTHIAERSSVGAVSHAHHDHECGPGGLPPAVAPPPAPPAVPEPCVLAIAPTGDLAAIMLVDAGSGAPPPEAGTQLLTRVCVARH